MKEHINYGNTKLSYLVVQTDNDIFTKRKNVRVIINLLSNKAFNLFINKPHFV